MTTTIESTFGKTLRFQKFGPSEVALKPMYWGVKNPDPQPDALFKAEDLIGALKAEGFLNGEFITDLPEAHKDLWGDYEAAGYSRGSNATRETVLKNAKALFAIHALMVKDDAEKKARDEEEAAAKAKAEEEAKAAEAEAAKKAEEARNWRRDQLVMEIRGFGDYTGSSSIFQKAIDRIIALETATA